MINRKPQQGGPIVHPSLSIQSPAIYFHCCLCDANGTFCPVNYNITTPIIRKYYYMQANPGISTLDAADEKNCENARHQATSQCIKSLWQIFAAAVFQNKKNQNQRESNIFPVSFCVAQNCSIYATSQDASSSRCSTSLLFLLHLVSILQPTSCGPQGGSEASTNRGQLNKTSQRAPVPPATP